MALTFHKQFRIKKKIEKTYYKIAVVCTVHGHVVFNHNNLLERIVYVAERCCFLLQLCLIGN